MAAEAEDVELLNISEVALFWPPLEEDADRFKAASCEDMTLERSKSTNVTLSITLVSCSAGHPRCCNVTKCFITRPYTTLILLFSFSVACLKNQFFSMTLNT